ncbi:hypothetical protein CHINAEXTREME_05605 [Halobiforma lacisalsi AJ5]|uniref:PH domain-containing protein n=1 Tax=Natronobacterium lacisalsi AJ5 TaxID=358396 RepID=M0LP27_NATLA|nr:hypothetical protein [Halobiforma lacisalsi]APW97279.1 hypothetical protein CHINAEXTREME_05605 [Halobiforma lacisalsi AJ5]EMA33790.1 hypothetical protein C445_08879 [Halobiforma lacisalsi AJ5]
MASPSPSDAGNTAARDGVVDRLAAVYAGVFLSSAAATIATAADGSNAFRVLALAGVALGVGTVSGLFLSRRVSPLSKRLGRSRRRRIGALMPALPFAAVGLAAGLGRLPEVTGVVALLSGVAIAVTALALTAVATTRYVDTVVGEPRATCRWTPPRRPVLDAALLVFWVLLAGINALGGDGLWAVVWAGLGVLWVVSGFVEGRLRPAGTGVEPELRVHDIGLVKRRPYTAILVRWDDVDHARLREGELVLERGLFDVRFDRDDLEDPDAVLAASERFVDRIG